MVNSLPSNTTKIEPKVKWGTVGVYLAGAASLGIVNALTADNNALLIEVLPDALEVFLLPMVPALVNAVVGFFAPHQWRTGEAVR